jgi:hypothetical protein
MKGQFFIIASVIIVLSLAGLITYVYDFGSIDMTEVGEMGSFEYIDYIRESLNKTVYSSYSTNDCNRIRADLDYTIEFLKSEISKKGITLIANYDMNVVCPPIDIDFNYSLKTPKSYTVTEFSVFFI